MQDYKIIQVERDKNLQGLLWVAVGGAAAFVKTGGFLRDKNATLKALAMQMALCSTIINRDTSGMKQKPLQWTATESHSEAEAEAVMLWTVKK